MSASFKPLFISNLRMLNSKKNHFSKAISKRNFLILNVFVLSMAKVDGDEETPTKAGETEGQTLWQETGRETRESHPDEQVTRIKHRIWK